MGIFSVENILGVLINSFAHVYIWKEILKEKINFKDYRYYIEQVLFSLSLLLNYYLINTFARVVPLLIILIVFSFIILRKSIKECCALAFSSEIILIISEFMFMIFIQIVYTNNAVEMLSSFAGKLITNVVVSLIAVLISKVNFVTNTYNKIIKLLDNINDYVLVSILIVILITLNLIFSYFYQAINPSVMLLINSFICFIYIFICFNFLKVKNEYFKINDKYNNTLKSLKEYEDILDVYRVSSHENKNQLLMIRNMILKEEKDIPEYIDKIIDNKIKDDEKLMFDTNKIPAGGLRAVVYSKLLVMKDEKIDFNLIVDRKVRTVDLIELGESLMLDVCRITGVFLDNAIEEVKKKDNKKIIVELFTADDNLCIKISNNFSGSVNIEKIYDKGYTTKSNGHGYGLSLVKEIVDKNNKLSNKTSVEKDMFTQLLEIKIK